jgi:DNA-binding GntR family transcriptional regulator
MRSEEKNGAELAGAGTVRLVASAGRGLLKERAYDAIKRHILSNDFAPGTFLAERQLAAQLGMSKTPVKAALERLELEGFITVSPQQGIVVRDLSAREIADQYEIRTALETYILRAVAGRLTRDQVATVRTNLSAQKRLRGSANVEEMAALDSAFHGLFAQFLDNQEVLRVLGQLRDKMLRVITKVFRLNPRRIDTSYEEHLALAEAAIAGDGELAARLMEVHLARGKQMILARGE